MNQHTEDTIVAGKPLVSVAMCTYNGAAFLQEQLDSIINQTYQNLEIVIVDDGSTDATQKIIQDYQQRDQRIKFYQNETNLGYNKNFEKACLLTTANYIAIADQDDIWALHKIETMLRHWKTDGLMLYSISREFYGDKPITAEENKPIRLYEGSMPEKLVFDSPIHGHALLFKRSLLDAALPFPATVFYDWWLSMVASAISSVECVPETLTYHRMGHNNSSRVLTSIAEKRERTEQLRQQSIHHIEEFLSRPLANEKTRTVLSKYVLVMKQKKDNHFSWPLFSFFLKNREVTFHYKRKRNFLSITKNSIKKSKTGL
jgi:glycosyltransferase involved in cell wall biosynthesis